MGKDLITLFQKNGVKMNKCGVCEKPFKQTHANQKYHVDCAALRRKRPASSLTPAQIKKAVRLAGTMFKKDLAKEVGCSWSALSRYTMETGVSFNALKYKDDVIRDVCDYYEEHGKKETQEKFPNVKIRSIIERYYKGAPRQLEWKDSELIELTKLSCFVSAKEQAKIFNRPGAHAGSITAAWTKKFKMHPGNLHGWKRNRARLFVTDNCPYIKLPNFMREGKNKHRLALWTDMENHFKSDCPDFVKDTVKGLANFQRWLFGEDPKIETLNIMLAFSDAGDVIWHKSEMDNGAIELAKAMLDSIKTEGI